MVESSGYVVVWTCLCSDAADDPAVLPGRCPGHDRPRVGEPIQNMRPGPVTPGHDCPRGRCRDHRPTRTPHDTAPSAEEESHA